MVNRCKHFTDITLGQLTLIILTLALVSGQHVFAATYYIRTDGSDSNTGTGSSAGQAWQTLQHAFDSGLSPGDIIYIRPGTYNTAVLKSNVSGTSASPIYFIGDRDGAIFGTPGEVICQATTTDETFELSNCSYLRFYRLSITALSSKPAFDFSDCQDAVIHQCNIYNAEHAVTASGHTFFVLNSVISNCSGNGIETGNGGGVIINSTIVGCGDDGVALDSGNTQVYNCIIANNGKFGVDTSSGAFDHDYNLFYNNGNGALDGASLGANSISADPQFAAGGYELDTGSPAIDSGDDYSSSLMGVLANDFDDGRRPSGAWDIGAYEVQADPIDLTILMVTANSTLTTEESARKSQFEAWGYTVNTLEDGMAQSVYDSAVSGADVVYVSEEVGTSSVGYKLRETRIGVIWEDLTGDKEMGFATAYGSESNVTSVNIIDNSHPITASFSTGSLTVLSTSDSLTSTQGTDASGGKVLATITGAAGTSSLMAIEIGQQLANSYNGSDLAFGRRVRLPVGGGAFSWANLNPNGLTIVKNAIEWASKDGLIGHWKLDETNGTTAVDSSDSGHDGTYTNGATPGVAGVRGYAAEFDGSYDHITISGGSDYNLRENVSVACWAKSDTATWSGWGCLVSKRNQFYIHPNYGGTDLYFAINQDGGGDTTATFDMANLGSIQEWHHYVGVYDFEAGEVRLYVDGELRATGSITAETQLLSDTGELTIGWDDGMTGTRYFDGKMDDVRLYERAITAAEVVELYGKIGHWKLDETSGTTAADSSGVGHNGVYQGSPTLGETGVRSNAMQKTLGSQYVEVTATETLDNLGADDADFSVAVWVKPGATTGDYRAIIHKGDATGFERTPLLALRDSDNRVHFRATTTSSFNEGGNSVAELAEDEWSQVVLVKSGSTLALYINGALDSTASLTGTTTGNEGNFYIGVAGHALSDHYDLCIDDVVLYDRAMTTEEIVEHHGLIAHWKFDELAGSTAEDETLANNDATRTGTEDWTTGFDSGGHGFDYSDGEDYFEAPSSGALNNVQGDDYTVMAYFNPNSVPSGSGSDNDANYAIIVKEGYSIGLCYKNDGRFFLSHWLDDYSGVYPTSADSYSAGQFYHVAGVVDRTAGTAKVYVNGVLVSTASFTPGAAALDRGTIPWRAGIAIPGASNWGWATDGVIDDARIYNRALSDDEVAKFARHSLIGHWKLDETSGTTAVDSSAAGIDGTYTNGATPGVAGFKDYAADFDGVDDHISISGGSTYNLRNNLTVACWAKSDTATWSGWGCLVSKRNQFYIHPSYGGTGIYMAINEDGGGDTTANFDMASLGSIQDWHHYVGVYDYDAGEVKLYVDGILRATGTITPGTQLVSDTGELTIGWDDGMTGTRYFDGQIDEVRLYREALTDAEVAELHGLVGHWKLDETSGSVATDSSGVNNQGNYWNGATPGGTGPYPGDGDTAAVLEGSDEHVGAYPTETYDNINETMSVAAWVLFDNDLSDQVEQEKIIYRENYSGNAGFALLADQPYGDRIIFRVHDGSSHGSATWTNPGIKAGQWHHYAGTYDGAVVRLYVDGQLKASTNFASSAIVQHTPNNLAIGTDLKGRMFDARLYNRALINEEIAQLAKVAGHWTMDETSGVDSTDMTALSNQGSYENAPTLGINSVYNAENGTAVWFDGASSHVTIPHNAQMLADDGAVMFWFRSSTLSGDRGLFSKDSNGYDDGGHLNIRLVDGKVQARLQSTSSSYELESSVIPATKWQHVAFTWGSEGTKLYLNGRLVDSDSGYTGGLGTTSGGDGNFEPIVLAADAQTSGDQSATPLQDYLEGGIDDVRFYTRQFYEDQVYQIYRNGRSPGVRILRWVETR